MIGGKWDFKKDGTFSYSEENCTGGRIGNGNYFINADSIHIRFIQFTDSTRKTSSIKSLLTDSLYGWKLFLEVLDEKTSESIPFATIIIKDSSCKILYSTQTDIDGHAFFNADNYRGRLRILVSDIGYEKIEYDLKKNGAYNIKANLVNNFGPVHIEGGTEWDYLILKSNSEKIVWQTTCSDKNENGANEKKDVKIELFRK
jgi:hypothetical protein